MQYKVLKIEEDMDFGCEERQPGEALMSVVLVEDENGYMKIKRLIPLERQDNLPAWVGSVPVRQTVEGFVSDDELPF